NMTFSTSATSPKTDLRATLFTREKMRNRVSEVCMLHLQDNDLQIRDQNTTWPDAGRLSIVAMRTGSTRWTTSSPGTGCPYPDGRRAHFSSASVDETIRGGFRSTGTTAMDSKP